VNHPFGHVLGRRELFGRQELRRLIDPNSVAVVGASDKPGSFGARTLENIRVGYGGKVYPVNSRSESIAGLKCYATLEDLPEVPDCVVVAVPKEHVESLAERAAAIGAGGMIIYSAGFAEVGSPALVDSQQRIARIAQRSGMRVLGPNCVGIVNLGSGIGLTFMPGFSEMPMAKGDIGLISQSGALGYCVLQAMQRGAGFSHYLSTGNSCDVDVCDLINYLVEDPATKVIACMFEGVRDGERLMEAARRALVADKPLLIYKLANSEISRRTAQSHTGTMAGAVEAYRAAFERAGVVVIDEWEELLEAALFFSRAGRPTAAGIGVMASSGGAAVMAADKADVLGISLPMPQPETSARLARVVPDFGSTANPCDLTAESLKSFQMYGDCIRAFADDPGYAAVVVPMMSAQKPTTVDRAKFLCGLAAELQKPICLVWINEWLEGPGSEVYDRSPRISMFRSMRRCLKALGKWLDHYQRRDRLLSMRGRSHDLATEGPVPSFDGGDGILSESQSKALLSAHGIPVTREVLATDPESAMIAAREIGFPIALKVDSAGIPHKTEAGVVRLGLSNEAEVRQVAGELLERAAALPGRPAINGLLVQKMAEGKVEMILGVRRDEQFGPLVVVGFGGIEVELTRDVVVGLAPVDRAEATRMIGTLKRSPLLTGFRNMPPLAVDALADAVVRLSELAWQLRDEVSEIDINPFILGEHEGIAVDALVVLKKTEAVNDG
jgi:acyl-CoA synthetase (NDP forming)